MKSKEQIDSDRHDLAEQKMLEDQKAKDLANEMVTTLISDQQIRWLNGRCPRGHRGQRAQIPTDVT